MTKNKLRLSPIFAAAAALVLLTVRTVQLNTAIEYPSGFCLPDGNTVNLLYILLMIACAVGLALLSYKDCRTFRGSGVSGISSAGAVIYGVAVIIYGAAAASNALSLLLTNVEIYGIICAVGAAAAIVLGMMIIADGKIKPYCCIPAMLLIISYIVKSIVFYVSNPIITGIPQKLMVMMIYVLTVLFWINTGRLFSGAEKALTRTASAASGLALGCACIAYAGSSFLLMLTDGEKWLLLDDTPDIELIAIGLIPAVLSLILIYSGKQGAQNAPAADLPQPIAAEDHNTPTPAETQPVENTVAVENIETVESAEAVESAETVEKAETVESTEPLSEEKADTPHRDEFDLDAILDKYSKKQ